MSTPPPGYGAPPGYPGGGPPRPLGYGGPPPGFGPSSAPPPGYPGGGPPDGTNGLCVASLVLGVAGLALCWVPFGGAVLPVVALCLGGAGLGRVRGTGAGRGPGVAGVVLGGVGLLVAVATTTVFLILWPKISPCVDARLSSSETARCLRDSFHLPNPTTDSPSAGPLLSALPGATGLEAGPQPVRWLHHERVS